MGARKWLPHTSHLLRQGLEATIKLDGETRPIPRGAFSKSEFVDYDGALVSLPSNLGDDATDSHPSPSILLPDDPPWEEIGLEFSLRIHPDMAKLIPPEERGEGIGKAVAPSVSIRCSKTALRRSVDLVEDETGTFSGSCVLSRDDVLGGIDVEAKLARIKDAPTGARITFARRKRGLLATSPVIKVYADERPSRGQALIQYRLINFETDYDGQFNDRRADLFALDLRNDDRVVCYVNTQSQQWPAITESTTGGKRGAVREFMNRSLVSMVLSQAYHNAFLENIGSSWADINETDSWRRYALAELAKLATKNASAEDQATWVDTHLESLEGDPDSATLLEELGTLIQRQLKIRRHGEKLADTLIR